jgi:adenylate cyclase, class 2
MPLNFEFKARTTDLNGAEQTLLSRSPLFIGEDNQSDTYFNVQEGRLKLREGNIENALIQYHREDLPESKTSKVVLYQHQPDHNLKQALANALGIKVVVEKKRKIYFIGNVKFHFDRVKNLGEFIEVEAIDTDGSIGLDKLQAQCRQYAELFAITESDYVAGSYSDLLLSQ